MPSDNSTQYHPLGAANDVSDLERGNLSLDESRPLLEPTLTSDTVNPPDNSDDPDESEIEQGIDDKADPAAQLSILDRYLPLWIFLTMVAGILMGVYTPEIGKDIAEGEFLNISLPIAAGLLIMMYPIMCKVQFESLHRLLVVRSLWVQVGLSLFINWIVAPVVMVSLAWIFLYDRPELREGLIMVGVARCIAMVMIWVELSGGDTDYGAILTAVNSLLQMFLFAPVTMFFINVVGNAPDHLYIPYGVVAQSVAVFLGIPLLIAVITRVTLRGRFISVDAYENKFIAFIEPFSLLGLLFTILILFASKGKDVILQLTSVLRVAAPMFLYFVILFFGTLYLCYKLGFNYKVSSAQSFTAASNNFELAIAVILSIYGISSTQALAATVGPLLEVPVLLSFVYIIRNYKDRIPWGNRGSSDRL
ncbi:sodium bile acid symporter family-domain-containing protein [Dipodascopsis uninucleata]